MKKKFGSLLLTIAIIGLTTHAFAQPVKYIKLKDGSTLKGRVLELKDGVYTIQTSDLGQIQLRESRIHTISEQKSSSASAQGMMPAVRASLQGNAQLLQQNPQLMQQFQSNPALMGQVQQLQGQLLGNPAIMGEIQNLMNDPEIMQMLADPAFIKDIMSQDPSRLENNPKVQKLMSNPEMKRVMDSIQSQMNLNQR